MSTTEAYPITPATAEALPSSTPTQAAATNSSLRKLVASMGVLFLYGPHMWTIRLLGRRLGLRWTRMLARLHYLASYFGAQKRLLRKFERIQKYADGNVTARGMLLRYLEVKHLSFVEWRLANTAKGYRDFVAARHPVKGLDHLKSAHARGKGVLAIVYHFGMYKLSQHWVDDLLRENPLFGETRAVQATYVSAHYSNQVYDWVARFAMRETVQTVEKTELQQIYLEPDPKPLPIVRRLRKQDLVGLAADGVLSADFLEVPFLDGSLELPAGWARLAAMTGAPVVSIFHTLDDQNRHCLEFHEPIFLEDRTDATVMRAVAKCAEQLEGHVRNRPWDWHIWHRISFLNDPSAPPHMFINSTATERKIFHAQS